MKCVLPVSLKYLIVPIVLLSGCCQLNEKEKKTAVATPPNADYQRHLIHWSVNRIAYELSRYIAQTKPSSPTALMHDQQFRKIARRRIGKYGYSAIINSDGITIAHPDRKIEGKAVRTLPGQTASDIIDRSLPDKYARGFYLWYTGEKYMVIVPVPNVFPDGKQISVVYTVESKNIEPSYRETLRKSMPLDDEIFYDTP